MLWGFDSFNYWWNWKHGPLETLGKSLEQYSLVWWVANNIPGQCLIGLITGRQVEVIHAEGNQLTKWKQASGIWLSGFFSWFFEIKYLKLNTLCTLQTKDSVSLSQMFRLRCNANLLCYYQVVMINNKCKINVNNCYWEWKLFLRNFSSNNANCRIQGECLIVMKYQRLNMPFIFDKDISLGNNFSYLSRK